MVFRNNDDNDWIVRDFGDGHTIQLGQHGKFAEFQGDEVIGRWVDTFDSITERIERRRAAERSAKKLKPSIPVLLVLGATKPHRYGRDIREPHIIHATFTGVNRTTGKPSFATTASNPGSEWQKNIEMVFRADQQTEAQAFLDAFITQRKADAALREAKSGGIEPRDIAHRSFGDARVDVEQANALIRKAAELLGHPIAEESDG